jgi:hypothetical protein
MNLLKHQKEKGISVAAILLTLIILILLLNYGSKFAMAYYERYIIKKDIAATFQTASDQDTEMSIKNAILKRFIPDDINVPDGDVTVTKSGDDFEVEVDYVKEIKINDQVKVVMDMGVDETHSVASSDK